MEIEKLTIKEAKKKLEEYKQLQELFNCKTETKPTTEHEYKGKHVIIRANRAGVFAGYIESIEGSTVVMNDTRRLWYWDGAASLSQLAVEGVSKPGNCKFPIEIPRIKVFDVIEIIETTDKAMKSIKAVKVWQK